MVVSGAPESEPKHADKICQMALDMVVVIGDLKDPSTGNSLKIRVGELLDFCIYDRLVFCIWCKTSKLCDFRPPPPHPIVFAPLKL